MILDLAQLLIPKFAERTQLGLSFSGKGDLQLVEPECYWHVCGKQQKCSVLPGCSSPMYIINTYIYNIISCYIYIFSIQSQPSFWTSPGLRLWHTLCPRRDPTDSTVAFHSLSSLQKAKWEFQWSAPPGWSPRWTSKAARATRKWCGDRCGDRTKTRLDVQTWLNNGKSLHKECRVWQGDEECTCCFLRRSRETNMSQDMSHVFNSKGSIASEFPSWNYPRIRDIRYKLSWGKWL